MKRWLPLLAIILFCIAAYVIGSMPSDGPATDYEECWTPGAGPTLCQ